MRPRRRGAAGRDNNGVERCPFRPALRAVAGADLDIAPSEFAKPHRCLFRQHGVPFDGHDLPGEVAQHRGRITRAGADFEHSIGRVDFRRLRHAGDDIGLGDRLPLGDRQRRILIGEFLETLFDESFAWHRLHRLQHARISYAASCEVAFDHLVPGMSVVEHGNLWKKGRSRVPGPALS